MRLFIAIDLPQEVKAQLGKLIVELAKKYPDVRWEKEEKLHLTLKFLGRVREIGEIREGIEKSIFGIAPFYLQSTKLGFFKNCQRVVIWFGLKGQEGLFQLVKKLENEMAKLGFPKEKRAFSLHVTLGRSKIGGMRDMREIRGIKSPEFGFQAKEIILMESKLKPGGSEYRLVEKFCIGG